MAFLPIEVRNPCVITQSAELLFPIEPLNKRDELFMRLHFVASLICEIFLTLLSAANLVVALGLYSASNLKSNYLRHYTSGRAQIFLARLEQVQLACLGIVKPELAIKKTCAIALPQKIPIQSVKPRSILTHFLRKILLIADIMISFYAFVFTILKIALFKVTKICKLTSNENSQNIISSLINRSVEHLRFLYTLLDFEKSRQDFKREYIGY